MNRLVPLVLLFMSLFLCYCNNSNKNDQARIGHVDDEDLDYLFFDYKVMAEEGDDNLTILLQFRDGGPNEPSLIVDDVGKVELDGENIPVDSTEWTGAFYELQKPIVSFNGKHNIVFTHGKKKFIEEFKFEPMVLKSGIPDTIERKDLLIELGGLEPEDYVRVFLFDTTAGDEINRLDTARNGLIRLDSADLEKLSTGNIYLELHREYEKPVVNGTREGGRIYIGYVLKRKLFLRDPPIKAENRVRKP